MYMSRPAVRASFNLQGLKEPGAEQERLLRDDKNKCIYIYVCIHMCVCMYIYL